MKRLSLLLIGLPGGKGFELLTADTDPRNAASIGLLKKVGLEEYDFQGKTFQVGEDWVDSVYLKLDKQTWSTKWRGLRHWPANLAYDDRGCSPWTNVILQLKHS